MAKPIEKLPAFKGKNADWMTRYLNTPKDAEAREQRRREDQELLKRVRPAPPGQGH